MKITLKNKQLNGWITFLTDMSVKGKASLGRTKLKKKLVKKLETYAEDESDVIDVYADWISKDEGRYEWKEGKDDEGKDCLKALREKEIEVDLFDYAEYTSALKKAILDFDQELTGIKADAWEEMVEAFEEVESEGSDNE